MTIEEIKKLVYDLGYNIIDEYITKSNNQMKWNWSNILDDEFLKSIEMKKLVYLYIINYCYTLL